MQSAMSDPRMAFQFWASNIPTVSSALYHAWNRVSSRLSSGCVLAASFGWVHRHHSMPVCGLDESGKHGPALNHYTFAIWGNCCLVKQYMPSKPGKYDIKSGQHAKLGPTTPGTCRCTSATLLIVCQERTSMCGVCVSWQLVSKDTTPHATTYFFNLICSQAKWLARTVSRNMSELLYSPGSKAIARVAIKFVIILTLSPLQYY